MATERVRATDVLDELYAAEVAGSKAVAAWLGACVQPALRGGLRVILARDREHARLAEERLVVLGAPPVAVVPRALQALCASLMDPDRSDDDKLATLVSRLPADTRDPLVDLTILVGDDSETRGMLEEVSADDAGSLGWLRGERADQPGTVAPLAADVLRALDALRAAEAAGAAVMEAWLAATTSPRWRGMLRVVASREAVHASVLEARLRELGCTPEAAVPEAQCEAARQHFGSRMVPDRDKVSRVAHANSQALDALIAACADDAETREMLRLVAAGERATVATFTRLAHGH